MRPAGKARRPRILGVFEGDATPPDGMQRGPNVTRLRGRGTSATRKMNGGLMDATENPASLTLKCSRPICHSTRRSIASHYHFRTKADLATGGLAPHRLFLRAGILRMPCGFTDHVWHEARVTREACVIRVDGIWSTTFTRRNGARPRSA